MRTLKGVEQALIISKNLKKARKNTSLLQKDVAEILGIRREVYVKYETGDQLLKIQELVMLSVLFNVTIEELLEGTLEAMQEEPNYT